MINDINFENGKAIIKRGRKIFAKVYDRDIFYPANKIIKTYSYPFSLEIIGLGIRECKSIEECKEFINKYID